jgi:hypothetical protein
MSGLKFSPERRIDLGHVIEAAPNPPNLSTLSEACRRRVELCGRLQHVGLDALTSIYF